MANFISNEFAECREEARMSIHLKERNEKFQSFKSLVQIRGKRRAVLSEERYLYLSLIYSVSVTEFSALIFCNENPPKRDQRLVRYFERFLCLTSCEQFRKNCASLAAYNEVPVDSVVKFLLNTLQGVIFELNKNRLMKSKPEHVLLNNRTLEHRFASLAKENAKLREEEHSARTGTGIEQVEKEMSNEQSSVGALAAPVPVPVHRKEKRMSLKQKKLAGEKLVPVPVSDSAPAPKKRRQEPKRKVKK
jgi:hypothetical protein